MSKPAMRCIGVPEWKITNKQYHQLDPGYGGYASCHLREGDALIVLTTPVSTAPAEEHLRILNEKIDWVLHKRKDPASHL